MKKISRALETVTSLCLVIICLCILLLQISFVRTASFYTYSTFRVNLRVLRNSPHHQHTDNKSITMYPTRIPTQLSVLSEKYGYIAINAGKRYKIEKITKHSVTFIDRVSELPFIVAFPVSTYTNIDKRQNYIIISPDDLSCMGCSKSLNLCIKSPENWTVRLVAHRTCNYNGLQPRSRSMSLV